MRILFRGEGNFAGGKFREIPFAVDFIFAGGKFRAKSKFANIAKISSTRKIGVIQYSKYKECNCCADLIRIQGLTLGLLPVSSTTGYQRNRQTKE